MIICSLRGEDSAGYINVDAGNRVKINKAVGSPFELFETREWDRLNLLGDKAIIGHTRKATVGGISKSTAHPFTSEHIHGVHNGTLHNWHKLFEADLFKVDSNALFHSIAWEGVDKTFNSIKGAWATVWWNEEENTLNFLKNDQRSLWWAIDEDGKKMYWASEYWMLQMLEQHTGVKFYTDDKGYKFFPFINDTHRRFEINPRENKPLNMKADREVKGDVTVANVPVPFQGSHRPPLREDQPWMDKTKAWCNVTKDWVPKEEARRADGSIMYPLYKPENKETPSSGPVGNTTTKTSTTDAASGQNSSTPSSEKSSSSQRPTLTLVRTDKSENSGDSNASSNEKDSSLTGELPRNQTIIDYSGKEIDEASFHSRTNSTCCFCSDPLSIDDVCEGRGKWIARDSYLCGSCSSNDMSLSEMCGISC